MSFENSILFITMQVVRCVCGLWLWSGIFGLLLSILSAPAANVLSSPGFESNPAGTNQPIYGWQSYGNNVYALNGAPVHTGNNYLKVYGGFSGADNYSGAFQD